MNAESWVKLGQILGHLFNLSGNAAVHARAGAVSAVEVELEDGAKSARCGQVEVYA